MAKEITRHVPEPIQRMLWGTAAGRCEFAGCNKPLWKSSVTQEQVNIAQKAHIYSFSSHGPRGNEAISADEINDLSNLMLVCHECHQKIDKENDDGRYTAELLQKMKASHEDRITLVTAIDPDRKSHILLYGANIGSHSSPLSFNLAAQALFPERYPAEDKAIELGMIDSAAVDSEESFWGVEESNLVSKFNQRVRERIVNGTVEHLSVFARAPQPLLIRLGTLLTDIANAEVYQLHREPQGWEWLEHPAEFEFITQEPATISGPPALVLSLSATINDERVYTTIGTEVTLWKVTIKNPHNDFLDSKSQLRMFRTLVRCLMNKIKSLHGEGSVLHIFPAVPVAVAVELGRIRMPKADLKWKIYDQVNARGGFIHALSMPGGETC